MTREEAIKLLEHISIAYTPTDAYGDYDDPRPYEEALDMAIEALQTEPTKAVPPSLADVYKWERDIALSQLEEYGIGFAEKKRDDLVEVVRCKDCRWFKQDSSPVGYGYCDGRMVGREVDYNDYCSFGELADKTKYPATYNTNTKCGGCVHLDELGRCLNFMLAKDDRSCWRGSWENNNGELAEQTDEKVSIDEIKDYVHSVFKGVERW